ncbi:hypothetical protein ACFL6S_03095 [Candidatus Poribacteria bacterium]
MTLIRTQADFIKHATEKFLTFGQDSVTMLDVASSIEIRPLDRRNLVDESGSEG